MQSDWISKSKGSGTLEQRLGSSLGARGRAANTAGNKVALLRVTISKLGSLTR